MWCLRGYYFKMAPGTVKKAIHLPYCYHIDRNYKTRERECQERGEKQACMSRFYEIWHEKIPDVKVNTFLSDLDGVNTNNLGFEHVNKVFTPLLFKRTKGKHP